MKFKMRNELENDYLRATGADKLNDIQQDELNGFQHDMNVIHSKNGLTRATINDANRYLGKLKMLNAIQEDKINQLHQSLKQLTDPNN